MVNVFTPRIAVVIALIIAVGMLGAGYFVGTGPSKFKSATRTVTVRGLADREVVADFVIWSLSMRRANANISTALTEVKGDRDRLIEFLIAKGFLESELERVPISIQDKQATQNFVVNSMRDVSPRYIASATVVVRSAKVDVARTAFGGMDELMQAGVLLFGGRDDGRSNLVYRFTKFNDLRPELIADATKNARASAEKFASDSNKKVGAIRSAQQGLIQIFGEEGQDEAGGYTTTSYRKKIRVVNTIEFDLVN